MSQPPSSPPSPPVHGLSPADGLSLPVALSPDMPAVIDQVALARLYGEPLFAA